jgi:hypothetical protein
MASLSVWRLSRQAARSRHEGTDAGLSTFTLSRLLQLRQRPPTASRPSLGQLQPIETSTTDITRPIVALIPSC